MNVKASMRAMAAALRYASWHVAHRDKPAPREGLLTRMMAVGVTRTEAETLLDGMVVDQALIKAEDQDEQSFFLPDEQDHTTTLVLAIDSALQYVNWYVPTYLATTPVDEVLDRLTSEGLSDDEAVNVLANLVSQGVVRAHETDAERGIVPAESPFF